MAYTEAELKSAAKKALAAGDTAAAKRLIDAARKAAAAPAKSPAMAAGLADLSSMTQNPPPPERGIGQMIYDNVIGDPTDGVQSYGEGLGTWMNRAGESMTLGLVGDEASAAAYSALPGRDYEGELSRLRGNEADMSGLGRVSADVFGAVLPAFIPGGQAAGAGILGKAAKGAATIAPTNVAARFIGSGNGIWNTLLRGGAAGAGMGAVQGFMEGEGDAQNRATSGILGAALGGGVGLAATGLGGVVGRMAEGRAARKAIAEAAKAGKSTDELRAAGNALYDEVDKAGVQIKPSSFDDFRADALTRLRTNTGFDELPGPGSLTPNSSRAVEIMGQASSKMAMEPTAALPFKALDQMRRQAGAAAGNFANKTDQAAGNEIIGALDDFVARLGPDDVMAGDVKALQGAIGKAREVWGQMSRSQKIDDAIDAGGDYLSGASSGIRNQFKNLLRNPKRLRGFSEAEKAAMRSVVNGGPLDQLVNLLGGGMAQLGSIAAGGSLGGFPGLIGGGTLAAGQRKLSEAMTTAAAEKARAAIASGLLRDPGIMKAIAASGAGKKALTAQGVLGLIPSATGALQPQ